MKKLLLYAYLLLILPACSPFKKLIESFTKPEFPIRIGVLADSQITTDKGTCDYSFRSREADKLVDVAIRPVALEYLAPNMLNRFLNKFNEQNVDIVLYLGDGANSGCADELKTVFDSLDKFRNSARIPTYFVVGNHDYLGTGNQTDLDTRKKLCSKENNENLALTKKQVIDLISDFNKKSATIDTNFTYKDRKSTRNDMDAHSLWLKLIQNKAA